MRNAALGKMAIRRILASGALALGVMSAGAQTASPSTVADVQLTPSGTTGQVLDHNPVVTAILGTPNTTNGVAYTRWIFLVDDGTGSIDVFNNAPLPGGYIPTVGDALNITGATNSPFSGVPEIAFPATGGAITKVSSGNPVPSPLVETIPQMAGYTTAPAPGSPYPNFAGHLVTVNDLTLSGASGVFGSSTIALTGTDPQGNKLALFYYSSIYSVPNANLFGTVIPTDPVNLTGLIQLFNNAPELVFMSITPYIAPPPVGSVYWYPNGPTGAPGAREPGITRIQIGTPIAPAEPRLPWCSVLQIMPTLAGRRGAR